MRKLLITLIVLAALLVGADFGAKAIAESKAAEAIARQVGSTTAPDVTIRGFPFLTQAIGGHYGHISLALAGADLGTLPVSGTAELYGVALPLSDALSGSTANMTADKADLTARAPVDTVAQALGKTGLTLSAGQNGAVRMTLPVTISGVKVAVSADALVSVTNGVLHLKAGTPSVAGLDLGAVSPQISATAAKALSLDVPLQGLPVRIDAAAVGLDGTDLIITATADHIKVADLR